MLKGYQVPFSTTQGRWLPVHAGHDDRGGAQCYRQPARRAWQVQRRYVLLFIGQNSLFHTRMSWNEDKWLIRFVQVCHDPALLCRQMDSHQRGHIWIRWESSPSISPMWECSNPHHKLFSLWLWFLAADEMRNGWREPSDHVYFALTLGRQQHRYEDKRHHTVSVTHCPAPFKGFPCTKGQITRGKSSRCLFSRNLWQK